MKALFKRFQAKKATSDNRGGSVEKRTNAGVVRPDSDELIALRRQAKGLRLAGRRYASSVLAGAHGSRFRGRGMDYQESRAYQAGDDIRNMDWRVTARAGHPYTKLYQEERERPVVLLLDLSPSMFFGTRGAFKSVVAARLAALIGWVTVAHGDRIGALLFNSHHVEVPPQGGRRGVLRLIRQLVAATDPVAGMQAEPHPDRLGNALQRLRRVARPGSLVFIISDFYAMDEETGKQLLHLRRHSDLAAIQIVDPLELTPPPAGRYGVTDGRRSGLLDTRSSRRRHEYIAWFEAHHRSVRELTRRRGIPLLQLSTSDDLVERLRSFLGNPRVSSAHETEGAAA